MLGRSTGELSGDLDQAVAQAHLLYQTADYDGAAHVMPPLLIQLDGQATGRAAAARRAGGYVAAAKLATKLGDAQLAWLTADRAHRAAQEAEDPALVGVARYQVACALLRGRYLADAQTTALEAADELASANGSFMRAPLLSARGALLLLAAVLAARGGDTTTARSLLSQAQKLAETLGTDGNFLWTGFGPTNVAIHELSVAVQLGDTRQANAHGATIDTDRLPTALIGRRSQVHLDLSRAAADAHDDSLAVLHLLEAERVAAQAVSRNANAQVLIGDLLTRERRNATPGLRALATRAGVADV